MRRRKLTPIFLEGIFSQARKKQFSRPISPDSLEPGHGIGNLQRYPHFKILIIFVAIATIARLFQLTIVSGNKYRELAEGNRIRYEELTAGRGRILDRNGQELAKSTTRFYLEDGNNRVQVDEAQVESLAKEGIAGLDFSGQLGKVKKEVVRFYPYGAQFAHVLGYVSPVQEADRQKDKGLSNLDNVGRLGIEETYDALLRGQNGARIVEVDATGKVISILGQKEATSGGDIKLTIDAQIQTQVFKSMDAQVKKSGAVAGAAIVADVATGEILAMVSYPSFNPHDIGQAVVDENKPLFNRAVSGTYPPGSVFKPVSAIAGLTSGRINRETQIEDVGEFTIGDFKFGNWYFLNYGRRDGILKIERAIARSNDIYFYRLGEMTGLENIRDTAVALGFGQKTGVDLPNEAFGIVPDEVWKQANLQEEWFLGDTMHLAIGQGFILSTPLQVATMTNVIANGGKLSKPHLVAEVNGGGRREILIDRRATEAVADPGVIAIVADGMRQACETGGTGWPFFNAPYKVGCKTGTAERAQGNPHAWFTAFAPYDSPQISVTVIIENGGEGSSVAAPVAREILDWYFGNNIKN